MATAQNGSAASAATNADAVVTGQALPDAAAIAAIDTGPDVADQDAMPVAELARAVLAREIRPRVSSVRRLAEAVVEAEVATKAKKAVKSGKTGSGKKKKKKLAKIPGQKK